VRTHNGDNGHLQPLNVTCIRDQRTLHQSGARGLSSIALSALSKISNNDPFQTLTFTQQSSLSVTSDAVIVKETNCSNLTSGSLFAVTATLQCLLSLNRCFLNIIEQKPLTASFHRELRHLNRALPADTLVLHLVDCVNVKAVGLVAVVVVAILHHRVNPQPSSKAPALSSRAASLIAVTASKLTHSQAPSSRSPNASAPSTSTVETSGPPSSTKARSTCKSQLHPLSQTPRSQLQSKKLPR